MSPPPGPTGAPPDAALSLDGVHLIRYGQYGGTGGLDVHLETLDRALAACHTVTIHQLSARPRAAADVPEGPIRHGRGVTVRVELGDPWATGAPVTGGGSTGTAGSRVKKLLRRTVRGGVVTATAGDNAVTDLLRKVAGAVGATPLLPEALPLTRLLPLVGAGPRRLSALQARASDALDRIARQAGGRPLLFVTHLPERSESLVVAHQAHLRSIPIGLVHHTGRTPGAALLFARTRRIARAAGAVSLRGLADLVGDRAVELGNGVDAEFFDRERAGPQGAFRSLHPDLRPGALLVICPGTISDRKRQLDVLRACRALRGQAGTPDFQVVLAGSAPDPEYRARVATAVERSGLQDCVVMVGPLAPEELRQAYRDADVGVLASRFEGRPRVVLEMGAMGLPVVVTDADGSRDTFLPGRSGLLVPVADPGRLAAAIGDLLTDPHRRAEFGRAGAEFVRQHHSLDLLVDRHVRFSLEILQPPHGSEASRRR